MAEKTESKRKEEIPEIFKDSFFIADKGIGRKTFAFSVSFLLFAFITVALIVTPLLRRGQLPEIEV